MIEKLTSNFSNAGVVKLEVTPENLMEMVKEVVSQTIEDVVESLGIKRQVDLITRKEAMELLRIKSEGTMINWEEKGYLSPRRISGRIFYEKKEVVEAVEKFDRIN